MRRAVLTLAGTAAGLAALLSFKTHAGAVADAAPATSRATVGSAPTPAAASSPAASASPAAGRSRAASTSTARPASAGTRTVTGTVASTLKGPMQVQLTLVGQKITKVTVLQQTDDGPESDSIDAFAIPKLTSETLVAQSARIDAVSGASYTSSGYIQSLQSALDQANA
jgi:uncharacterized protein with FMN-binding domain